MSKEKYVERDEHVQAAGRTSLHPDQRDPQRDHPLQPLGERRDYRGGTRPHGRRRFRDFKPISGQESAPNAFEGAASIILTPDRRFLFTTNGGDNSVSSFRVGEDGRLTLLDCQPTGNPVEGRSGTAKSLAYAPSRGTLYVLHSFGPDHVRLMSVDGQGKLTARPERYTVNTHDKPNRVSTMVVVSPDEKLVFVGTTFDEPIVTTGLYPDGSPMLWVQRGGGAFHSIASNTPDPDGLAVFPLREDGSLGTAKFYDAGGGSPFYIAFLHGRPDTFVIGYAVGDGCSMGTIEKDGKVNIGKLVKIDTSAGLPSELCWLAVSPDDRTIYATNFGYSNISSYPHQRQGPGNRERSGMPEGSGRRHRQGALWRRHQRPGRQLDHAGWCVSLPDLRQCRETGGLRDPAGRFAYRGHQREDSLQQPAGPGGILIEGWQMLPAVFFGFREAHPGQ